MKYLYRIFVVVVFSFGLWQCSNNTTQPIVNKPSSYFQGLRKAGNYAGVMMEGFYWNTPSGWWDSLANSAAALSNMAGGYGIDRIWFPPAYKGQSGSSSMGYDPTDYYDLGNYYQNGTTATRFGTLAELQNAIASFHANGISVMEDLVLNHRSGGASESNPVTGGSTWTDFSHVASGQCLWHWDSFHPNYVHASDPGTFGGMPDVCYESGSSYTDIQTWMKWLQSNIGFDGGWRFDYCKGIYPWVVYDMKNATGNPFSVGEYWDSNTSTLEWWVGQANASAFDFALYYTMANIFNNTSGGGYMPNLIDPNYSFAAKDAMHAVTFCGNHDTDQIITDKMIGYAFILTYQGYPCIWWKDYYNYGLATLGGEWGNGINQLVWVRGKLAAGSPNIQLLKTDDGDLLIYGSYGYSTSSPGYIVALNDNSSNWLGATVTTGNNYLKNQNLKCYAWYSSVSGQNAQPQTKWCDGSGNVQVWAPPRGYAVYSVDGL